MAELRKIVPRPALSDFRQTVNPGPSIFDALADAAGQAYQFLAPAAVEEMKRRGTAEGLRAAGGGTTVTMATSNQAPNPTPAPVDPNSPQGIAGDTMAALGKGDPTLDLIRGFEGFRETPYWDVNALRTGYGSDTVTLADGTVQKVMEGTRVSREDAERDLARRVSTEFQPIAIKAVGEERWANMTANQKAALSSIAYNYGEIPSRITEAVQSGDPQAGAAAIAGLGGDNNGVNRNRRAQEAALFAGGPLPAGGGVTASTMGGQPTTMVRTTSGKVEPRLFSPLSGPILQAHNAAAGVAYLGEKMVQGQTDLISMANDFALNPQGFQQAADAYIGQMVQDAPEQFRGDLMAEMRGQAQKTFLGIVEDQQRDTRQRAANASSALVDRWLNDYAGALTSGDMAAANAAEANLRSVLRARETLPGIAWTPEQSENVVLSARNSATKAMAAAQKETETGFKNQLNTIIDAAKAGMTAADEAILADPNVQAMMPELWREATAFTTLRDQIPTFNTMTPAQQATTLIEMKAQPVQEDWEVDLYGAAEKVVAENAKAWRADPIKRAGEVLTDEPPPQIPELDPNNPEAFMAALGERATYANKLTESGYTDRKVYVSKEEAKTLGAMFGKDVPPELKAMAAGAIVGVMGDDAAGFFQQIKTNDPVIPHVGALMARGGDTTVAVEAMTGQMYLDNKTVPAPSAKAVQAGKAPFDAALRAVPGIEGGMDGITKVATTIYAARIPANADEEMQAEVMQDAWQAALGQSEDLGILRGGIQEVGGQQVLLPPTIAGEDLNTAMESAFGFKWAEGWGSSVANAYAGKQSQGINTDFWMKAAGGIPALGGEPISPDLWNSGELTMTPVGGSKYMLSVIRNGVVIDIGVQGQSDDVPFIFDAEALIGASLVP